MSPDPKSKTPEALNPPILKYTPFNGANKGYGFNGAFVQGTSEEVVGLYGQYKTLHQNPRIHG